MNKTLIFLIDAVRPDYINEKDTPFLNEIEVYPVKSLLGYSCGIHPSIWTGTYQQDHGAFLIFYYDPENSPFKWTKSLKFIPNFIRKYFIAGLKFPYYAFPEFRPILPKFIKKILPLPPAVPLDIAPYFSTGGIEPKGKDFFQILAENEISYSRQGDYVNRYVDEVKKLEDLKITKKKIDYYYLYWADHYGHWKGPNSKPVRDYLRKVDQKIKELYREAKEKSKQVDLFVFSDHGMCKIKEYNNVQKYLKNSKFKIKKDYLPFYDSTLARFWILNEKIREEFIKFVRQIPKLTYLDERLLKKYGINFKNKKTYGEVICLSDPEVRIYPDYFAPLHGGVKGLHGFDPEFPDSKGIFISNCVSLKKEIKIVDILPILLKQLGLNFSKIC